MNAIANILFVSVENAARSQLAEACLRHLGKGRFGAYSCGSPEATKKSVSPKVLEVLSRAGMPISLLIPKSWDHFKRPNAPSMDFVICLDADISEFVPAWPRQPEQALWKYSPLGSQLRDHSQEKRIEQTLFSLHRRIELLINLHSKVESRRQLRDDLKELGHH